MARNVCPECVQAKHGNCDGTAWHDERDEVVVCDCYDAEHEEPKPGRIPAASTPSSPETTQCDVRDCDQPAVRLLANAAPLTSPDYREWYACRWHKNRANPPLATFAPEDDIEWDEGRCTCGHAPSSHQFGGQGCHLCGCRRITYSPGTASPQ